MERREPRSRVGWVGGVGGGWGVGGHFCYGGVAGVGCGVGGGFVGGFLVGGGVMGIGVFEAVAEEVEKSVWF